MTSGVNENKISEPAIELLRELAVVPEMHGYDHRIRELDEHKPPLIQWMSGYGYGATDAGHEFLVALPLPLGRS